jgi:hypothetical protein
MAMYIRARFHATMRYKRRGFVLDTEPGRRFKTAVHIQVDAAWCLEVFHLSIPSLGGLILQGRLLPAHGSAVIAAGITTPPNDRSGDSADRFATS